MMDYLDELVREVRRLSESTNEIIELFYKLLHMLSCFSDSSNSQFYENVYYDAIHVLENVFRANDYLLKDIENYMCCCSAPDSVTNFKFRSQGDTIEHGNREPKGKGNIDASIVEARRKALAEALRRSEPVVVDSEGTKAGLSGVETVSTTQENASISASTAEERRKALADALRKGAPVVVDSEGTVVDLSGASNITNKQGRVSSQNDTHLDAIVVADGKLAGGSPSHCRVCDSIVFSGANYCPYCGSAIFIDQPSVKIHKVQFSAVAPKVLIRGEYSIINIIMYEESCRHIVDELIKTMDEPVFETRTGVLKVTEGAEVKIILNSPDLPIEDNTETGIWQGEYLEFSFSPQIPTDYKKRQILFTAFVYINDVIASRLKFIVKCSSLLEQKIQVSRSDVLSAFVSYASQDRNRVAAIIQGMKKARPDLDVFFDVDSLRSGDDWEQTLHDEIERRDVLFLCWSHFARESKWVNKEWRYAFEKKGIESIEPVPIEPPDICPPPEELRKKHFNDKLLYIINSPEY